MKGIVSFSVLIGFLTLVFSCGETKKPEVNNDVVNEKVKEICLFYHHDDSVNVHWVAYKHTAKAAVHGDFDSVKITSREPVKNIEDMVSSASFTIFTSSSNSKDAARDMKIKKTFFGSLASSNTITGKVKSLEGSKAIVSIKMNEIEKDIPMVYTLEGDKIRLETSIDIKDWNAQDALALLNEVCSERHTGADGVNKLWDEVKISVSTTLLKDCK